METLKVLGQASPAANNLTDIYAVPGSTQTTISSIIICNQGSSSASFSISVAINGAGDAPEQYIYYNMFLDNNDTFVATVGISLSAGDVIRFNTNIANVSINIFGVEVS